MFEWGPWEQREGLDSFTNRPSFGNQHKLGLSCTFCGSLDPNVVMAGLRDGTLYLSGSDKSYKTYIGSAETVQAGKFYFVHLNAEQAAELLAIWVRNPERVKLYVKPWLPALAKDAPEWLRLGT